MVAPIAPPSEANTNINGDAMDVDHNGHTHVTNSVRAESEVIPSDAESPTVAEIPISTLSIGQSTEVQTDEQPRDLAPNTSFACSVKGPYKKVSQTLWGTPQAPLLLAAGTSIVRLHYIPPFSSDNSTGLPRHTDLSLPLESYSITALCWNSEGEVTLSAREERTNEVGEIMKSDKLYKCDGGLGYRVISSTAGLVTTLRWNDAKRLLLAISGDDRKGSVKIWRDAEDDGDFQLPAWTTFTATSIFDAIWISDSSFVICGDGLFEIYEIGESLSCQRKFDTHITWETVKYDASSGILAALGIETGQQKSFLGIVHPNNPDVLQVHEYPDLYFSDLDFRPRPTSDALGISSSASPVWLATCAASGAVRIWDANQPFKCLKQLPIMDESMVNNIAFHPDGKLLAAAGPDTITVWDLDRRDGPIATWRARDFGNEDWDPNIDGDFSLGWEPVNEGNPWPRLSIALGNQVCLFTTVN